MSTPALQTFPPAIDTLATDLLPIHALKITLGLTEKIIPVYARTREGASRTYFLKITRRGLTLV